MTKKIINIAALTVCAVLLVVGIVVSNTQQSIETNENNGNTAGIVAQVSQAQLRALDSATISEAEVTKVAEATSGGWEDKLMADVDEYIYVREAGDKESAVAGKLRKGDVATVVSTESDWYVVTSGNLTGYVSADYCVVGTDAYELSLEDCETYATTTTAGLRIREEAAEDGKVLKSVEKGSKLTVDTDADEVDGWVKVSFRGTDGYVSADFVDVATAYGTGITKEEEAEAIAKAKAEEEAKKAKQISSVAAVQNSAVAASADDVTLLAALIQCEGGNECYEGQVAVGAVVMNRLRSGAYGGSLYDVIYARGQFGPARSGKVANVISRGPKSTCMQAAQEALSGYDNTGGARHFKRASSGHAGVVIGNHVFY